MPFIGVWIFQLKKRLQIVLPKEVWLSVVLTRWLIDYYNGNRNTSKTRITICLETSRSLRSGIDDMDKIDHDIGCFTQRRRLQTSKVQESRVLDRSAWRIFSALRNDIKAFSEEDLNRTCVTLIDFDVCYVEYAKCLQTSYRHKGHKGHNRHNRHNTFRNVGFCQLCDSSGFWISMRLRRLCLEV